MKLNPSEISNLIRSRIENFEALTQARTEGYGGQRHRRYRPRARAFRRDAG